TDPGSGAHADEAWMIYGHRLRPEHRAGPRQEPPPDNPPGFENDSRRLIANMMGYNTADDDNNQDVTGSRWVGDLMLDCTVEVTDAQGEFVLDLAKGVDRFQARFDVASGVCKLVRMTGHSAHAPDQPVKADPVVLDEKPTRLKGTGTYHVRFANFDERLTVWVDGRLPFGDG